ncbi:MAG: cytochrome c oxidase subunit [Gaiellales bacterium]|nr:cytochrome c oxidase subunit [Gaiellales bacterium]
MRRIAVIWLVLSVVGVLAVWFGLEPHMPPGTATAQAHEQREANTIIAIILTPITLGLLAFFGYALTNFRQRGELLEDGPPLHGDARLQGFWVAGTVIVVLFLAAYGTYALYATESDAAGSGGGQGATLISAAPSDALQVQVVSQQWQFTYRYPQYGGVETTELALPAGRTVVFHVTSLDVIHSFWAYQLGVKVDAVPGTENLADVTPHKVGSFTVRCAELCGVWHGAMSGTGRVLSKADFASWIAQQQTTNAPGTAQLPPYHSIYFPDPIGRAG